MSAPWRQVIREQLEMLASESQQLQYERTVPHVDITRELVAGWFDDSYHPNDADFRSCFAGGELHALAKFDATYEERLALLPPSHGSVKSWLASEIWHEVMTAASIALELIQPNPTFQRTAKRPLN